MRYKLLFAFTAWLLSATLTSFAADQGATLYKKKCAACHGVSGEGKAGMKAPALKGTALDVIELVTTSPKVSPQAKLRTTKVSLGLRSRPRRLLITSSLCSELRRSLATLAHVGFAG